MDIDDLLARERASIGREVGPTAWREVRQEDIDAFGRSTYDPDPMHVDPEWAARHSPFGGTIAFGYWTLSMLTAFMHELAGGADGGAYEGVPHERLIGVNYGCDRLRFIEPVPVGGRIRARMTPVEVTSPAPDRILRTVDVNVEIEGRDRPALSARWLSLALVPEPGVTLQGFRRTDGAA